MNEKLLHTLLSVIKNNGDIKKLRRNKITYADIANLIEKAIQLNYLITTNTAIEITETGLLRLLELDKHYKLIDKSKWIDKESRSIITKLEKDFIYLPNQNELTFK